MPGGNYTPVKLGPWTGGMNTISDASAISENEVVDCVNLELDFDGSLLCRPPVTSVPGPVSFNGHDVLMLGYFTFSTGAYLIASNQSGTYYKLGGGPWTTISTNLQATSAVQYGGDVYILATNASTTASGRWNPSAGFRLVTGMPRGQTILVYKDRGFIAAGESAATNSSRLYFSKVTDLTDWTTATITGQIDINPGDGQDLVDIIVYQNAVVCFKQHSTYVYSFTVAPSDGAVRNLSTTIGVLTHHCVVSFENSLYLYHDGKIYELLKFNYQLLNPKVSFVFDGTSPGTFLRPVFLTLQGTRLLVRYYHRVYAFGLRTRTWGRWESSQYFGPLVMEPLNAPTNTNPRYFGGSCISNDTNVYQCNDGFDNTQSEAMTLSVLTKTHDMSHQIRVGRYFLTQEEKIKRQFWWGAQVQSANAVTGSCTPLVSSPQVSWQSLASTPWQDLNTWEFPLSSPAIIETVITPPDGQFSRFIKFQRGVRFRIIKYRVDVTTTGTLAEGPDRIFQMTAMIASKAYQSDSVG